MGWFSDDSSQYQSYNTWGDTDDFSKHKPDTVHELIAGAAAYEATKAYEDHCAANGRPQSHAKAKEIMAGLAGAFIDREVESKGLDFIDREKAKYEAKKHLNDFSEQDYGY